MVISDIQLYEILKERLGQREAEAVVEVIDRRVEKAFTQNQSQLSTKGDLHEIKEQILRLETKIAETKAETIRWTFGFFVTLALMVIGLYLK